MILRYRRKDGTQVEFELGDRPITIGRSPEADLVILDEKASRLHCGIRLWDDDFILKDLHSRNGTFVNEQRVEMTKLNPGDRVRIGQCVFTFDQDASARGGQTLLTEVQDEMAKGKGYSTLLREIVEDAALPVAEAVSDAPPASPSEVMEEVEPEPHPEATPAPDDASRPKTVRIKITGPGRTSSANVRASMQESTPKPVKVESNAEPPEPAPAPKRNGPFKIRVPAKPGAEARDRESVPPTVEAPKPDTARKPVQFRLKVPPKK